MYTAVSACLKQLAQSFGTTFNHAFVYVIKIKKKKKTAPKTVSYCAQLRSDQIFQYDVGPVSTVAHIASKCSWFNDMQVIQIKCKLPKVFQECVNKRDSSPTEYIFAEYVLWTPNKRLK